MSLIYLIIIVGLIITAYIGGDKIKRQDAHIKEFLEEKSKMSDALRVKENEVIRLTNRVKKLENLIHIGVAKR